MKDGQLIRRDFMRWIAVAGASTTLPGMALMPRMARASGSTQAPLFVSFQATGAYDITLICDPRGNDGSSNPPNLGYVPADIKTFGKIDVAPQFPSVVDFFSTYYQNILVINGIDTNTIDHASGVRSSMSGITFTGYPVTGALVGAILGSNLPAPFMANGGDCYTADLVGMTQLGPGIADALLNPMDGGTIHRPEVWTNIQQAMANRLSREQQGAVASQRSQHLKLMQEALGGASAMSQLTETINDLVTNVPQASPNSANLAITDNRTALDIRVGLAGYFHGQTAALHIAGGIFDSHSNNDAQQQGNDKQLFSAIDYLLRCAAHLNISNNMLVYVGSDFARTPYYNHSDNGKDHWPTTSALVINPSHTPNTPVNMVIGTSDARLNPLSVNPKTLLLDDSGVHIQPGHIHDALRRYMGIATNPLAINYNLHMSETLPLLG